MVDSIGGPKEARGQEMWPFCQCFQNPAGLSITGRYSSLGSLSYCRIERAPAGPVVHLSAEKQICACVHPLHSGKIQHQLSYQSSPRSVALFFRVRLEKLCNKRNNFAAYVASSAQRFVFHS